ncbi:MAG: hypothetical protein ACYC49_03430 [Ignavibacteriaceae bacterium]
MTEFCTYQLTLSYRLISKIADWIPTPGTYIPIKEYKLKPLS